MQSFSVYFSVAPFKHFPKLCVVNYMFCWCCRQQHCAFTKPFNRLLELGINVCIVQNADTWRHSCRYTIGGGGDSRTAAVAAAAVISLHAWATRASARNTSIPNVFYTNYLRINESKYNGMNSGFTSLLQINICLLFILQNSVSAWWLILDLLISARFVTAINIVD